MQANEALGPRWQQRSRQQWHDQLDFAAWPSFTAGIGAHLLQKRARNSRSSSGTRRHGQTQEPQPQQLRRCETRCRWSMYCIRPCAEALGALPATRRRRRLRAAACPSDRAPASLPRPPDSDSSRERKRHKKDRKEKKEKKDKKDKHKKVSAGWQWGGSGVAAALLRTLSERAPPHACTVPCLSDHQIDPRCCSTKSQSTARGRRRSGSAC